ncbi:MAG: cyclic nucleotide-binding domain-containing protein [Alphaproteobacteria bacterium]|nr:cyclic nucleotide-binding domain-containing protein [Alphaproteobacteria bacterium]
METARRIAFLKTVSIFSETPDEVLKQIADHLIEMEVSEGDHIVLKGELGDAMYIIVDGRVKVHDAEYIFSVLKTRDVFGKYYLLDKKERSATVTALSHTFLYRFNQDLFYRITRTENTIIRGVLKALVRRLRDMNIAEEQLAAQNHEIVRQKEELEKQKRELIELNATKDKFFSIIAHDLRSPITTLISLAEVLRTDIDLITVDETHEILTSLHSLSRNYLKLLDNLLQWARIQTGRMVADPQPFDLIPIINEVIDFYKVTAGEKRVNLVSRVSGTLTVIADPNMIKTVLRNLISNALKYTAMDGTVTIATGREPGFATVIVSDTGLGMTPTAIESLFKLEKTFSTAGTANEKGTGLGLILCKEFIEKNGGKISVESEYGQGSTFSFTVPFREGA